MDSLNRNKIMADNHEVAIHEIHEKGESKYLSKFRSLIKTLNQNLK